jgi:hypothetical protein
MPENVREEALPHQPQFEHLLVDLGRVELTEAKGRLVLHLVLSLMKAARTGSTRTWMEKELPFLARLLEQKSVAGLVIAAMRYWYETNEDPVSTFQSQVAN